MINFMEQKIFINVNDINNIAKKKKIDTTTI